MLNKNFFKFLFGFIAIILISIAIAGMAGYLDGGQEIGNELYEAKVK